jgi:hypothetical protein
VCRLEVPDRPASQWPQLTPEGHFAFKTDERGTEVLLASATGANRPSTSKSAGTSDTFREDNKVLRLRLDKVSFEKKTPGLACAQDDRTLKSESSSIVRDWALVPYSPGQSYALCCPDCGVVLDRDHPEWHALAPERAAQRKWSYRISQLLIPAIDLAQIVAAWQLAIRDPEHMTVFCTDRLALPKSTTQTLTPGVMRDRSGERGLHAGEGKRNK